MKDLQKRTWAEVSLDNIEHNYRAIRAELPEGCRFLGIVKADAYGHGAVEVAKRHGKARRGLSCHCLPRRGIGVAQERRQNADFNTRTYSAGVYQGAA